MLQKFRKTWRRRGLRSFLQDCFRFCFRACFWWRRWGISRSPVGSDVNANAIAKHPKTFPHPPTHSRLNLLGLRLQPFLGILITVVCPVVLLWGCQMAIESPQVLQPTAERSRPPQPQPQNPAQNQTQPNSPTATPTPPIDSPSPVTSATMPPLPSVQIPSVQTQRLLNHLERLNFERASNADRAQARAYLNDQLTALGWNVTEQPFALDSPTPDRANIAGVNLIAEWEGVDRQAPALVIGAHYDSVPDSPGADDNASGVVAMLEIATLMTEMQSSAPIVNPVATPTAPPSATTPNTLSTTTTTTSTANPARYLPPRSLRLVFFDLEEIGFIGSFHYVAQLAPGEIQGALILEMLGYQCDRPGCQSVPQGLSLTLPEVGNFLGVLGSSEHPQLLEAIAAVAHRPQTLPIETFAVPLQAAIAPALLRSDHVPFWLQNIGAVMLTDTANYRNPHYHQATDTPDTLNPDFLTRATQLVWEATWQLLLDRPQV